MYCSVCGKENESVAKFCSSCGINIEQTVTDSHPNEEVGFKKKPSLVQIISLEPILNLLPTNLDEFKSYFKSITIAFNSFLIFMVILGYVNDPDAVVIPKNLLNDSLFLLSCNVVIFLSYKFKNTVFRLAPIGLLVIFYGFSVMGMLYLFFTQPTYKFQFIEIWLIAACFVLLIKLFSLLKKYPTLNK